MGFENHSRTGLLERAAQIAIKHGVTYNSTWHEFRGEPEGVKKAAVALLKWMNKESSRVTRAKYDF